MDTTCKTRKVYRVRKNGNLRILILNTRVTIPLNSDNLVKNCMYLDSLLFNMLNKHRNFNAEVINDTWNAIIDFCLWEDDLNDQWKLNASIDR